MPAPPRYTPRPDAPPTRVDILAYKHGRRQIAAPAPTSYSNAIRTARTLFRIAGEQELVLQSALPELGFETDVEISEQLWPLVSQQLTNVTVTELENSVSACHSDTDEHSATFGEDLEPNMRICIKSLTGKSHYFKVNALWSIGYVKFLYQERFGTAVAGQRLIFAGKQMKDQPTLADYNIQNGMSIHMVFRLTGGKPVIYLLPPVEMDVSVSLCLTPQWSFSAIYPVAAKEPINFVDGDVGQGTKWNVRAHPGGLLTDKATGIEVTYLFWEAETNPELPLSPPVSPNQRDQTEIFDPAYAHVYPWESVLLSVAQTPAYLDAALLALGLDVEARTSFITYWLPAILKHSNIALRFLPQRIYELAAPLKITPTPTIISRVFMLFRGLSNEEASQGEWQSAKCGGERPVDHWREIVGYDEMILVEEVFRVLEWGGMEVL